MSVSFKDFKRLDLRIGKVVKVERIKGLKKILKLQVDIGKQIVQTVVGGAEYYKPEYFLGKLVVILVNLEPKLIAGVESRGMLLAADFGGKPIWLTIEGEVPSGTQIK